MVGTNRQMEDRIFHDVGSYDMSGPAHFGDDVAPGFVLRIEPEVAVGTGDDVLDAGERCGGKERHGPARRNLTDIFRLARHVEPQVSIRTVIDGDQLTLATIGRRNGKLFDGSTRREVADVALNFVVAGCKPNAGS